MKDASGIEAGETRDIREGCHTNDTSKRRGKLHDHAHTFLPISEPAIAVAASASRSITTRTFERPKIARFLPNEAHEGAPSGWS